MRKANGQQSNPSPAPVAEMGQAVADLQGQVAQIANAVQLLMANVPEATFQDGSKGPKASVVEAKVRMESAARPAPSKAVSGPSERQLRNVKFNIVGGILGIDVDLTREGQETARGNESIASAFWVPVGTLADGRTLSLQLQLVAKAPKGGKR